MDNQQAKAIDIDLAWLAGFIDGEGSFMVVYLGGKRLRKEYRERGIFYIAPRIVIANTDQPVLTVIQKILNDHGLPHHVSQNERGVQQDGSVRKDYWDIRVQGMKRCLKWCKIIIPHLRLKQDQAQAMLRLIELRLNAKNGDLMKNGYSPEEKALIESLRGRISKPHRLHDQQVSLTSEGTVGP